MNETTNTRAAELIAEASEPLDLRLMVPHGLNDELALVVGDIAEAALQAFYAVVCERITETVGGTTYGDVSPGEAFALDKAARRMVLAHALNNENAVPPDPSDLCVVTADGEHVQADEGELPTPGEGEAVYVLTFRFSPETTRCVARSPRHALDVYSLATGFATYSENPEMADAVYDLDDGGAGAVYTNDELFARLEVQA